MLCRMIDSIKNLNVSSFATLQVQIWWLILRIYSYKSEIEDVYLDNDALIACYQ